MSKRHQNSRRKAYGRRQHEVRERTERGHMIDMFDVRADALSDAGPADRYAFLDAAPARLRFALGD